MAVDTTLSPAGIFLVDGFTSRSPAPIWQEIAIGPADRLGGPSAEEASATPGINTRWIIFEETPPMPRASSAELAAVRLHLGFYEKLAGAAVALAVAGCAFYLTGARSDIERLDTRLSGQIEKMDARQREDFKALTAATNANAVAIAAIPAAMDRMRADLVQAINQSSATITGSAHQNRVETVRAVGDLKAEVSAIRSDVSNIKERLQ